MQLSQRLERFSEPQTLKMAKLGRDLQAQGIDIINLSLGEPDFGTPEHINAAAKRAIDEGYSKYPPISGFADLRQAICDKLKRDNNLDYKPEEVMVSTGAKQALINAILAVVDPGDEVIIPTPYWVTYSAQVQLAEAVPVFVPCSLENHFKITPQQLEEAITERTRLFMFSSPCNPSGAVYSKEELKALAAVFEKYPRIFILSDEIYEYINFVGKHESIAQFTALKDRMIVINGLSKGYAMTGWRLGYMAAPAAVIAACDKLQGQFTSGACSITQRAAIAALEGTMEPTMEMVKAFHERRDYVIAQLKDMPGIRINLPEGAFYAFPDVSSFYGKSDGETTINNDEDLIMYLLHKARISTVNGSAFGAPDCIRLSFAAAMPRLVDALNRMRQALQNLK